MSEMLAAGGIRSGERLPRGNRCNLGRRRLFRRGHVIPETARVDDVGRSLKSGLRLSVRWRGTDRSGGRGGANSTAADAAAGSVTSSAEAIWMPRAAASLIDAGLARGIGTGPSSATVSGMTLAITLAGLGFAGSARTGALSSSSSADLPLNSDVNRLGLLRSEAPSPRFSISAIASSYPASGWPSDGT